MHPTPIARPATRHPIYSKLVDVTKTSYSILTGRLPVDSYDGNKYLLVMLCAVYIKLVAVKSKSGPDLLSAFTEATDFFTSHGIVPVHNRLDNECAILLRQYCAAHSPVINLEFAPPITIIEPVGPSAQYKQRVTISLLASAPWTHRSLWTLGHASTASGNNPQFYYSHTPMAPPEMAPTLFYSTQPLPGQRTPDALHVVFPRLQPEPVPLPRVESQTTLFTSTQTMMAQI